MGKTLLVTKSFPPVAGGTAFLLFELTRHFKIDELSIVHGINESLVESDQTLPFKRKQVLFLGSGKNTLRLNRYFPRWYVYLIRIAIRRAIKRDTISSIYIHYPNGAFAVGAYLEAKRAGIPYLFYQDILWEEREKGAGLELAKKYESKVISEAKTCVAITEFAAEHQTQKHSREFFTIPHTLDSSTIPSGFRPHNGTKKRVHFAGGIYPRMNEDSIIRFMEACRLLPYEFEFEFCSPNKPESLKDYDIEWKYLSKEKLLEAQRNSDLVFLPQAFESSTPQMIQHNFPTKTMEYLCSGRPILVHSPADSYLSDLCRRKGFGMLVDQPDVKLLASQINLLLSDETKQKSIVNKALTFAKERDSRVWHERLKELLSKQEA